MRADPIDWADVERAVDEEREIDRIAEREMAGDAAEHDTERTEAGPTWTDRRGIVEMIRARAGERWVSLGVGLREIVSVRAGAIVTLSGPTGAGKSSLAAGLVLRHADEQGWGLVLSRELSTDEIGARMIGMRTDRTWREVLRGELSDAEMLAALPVRIRVVDLAGATLDALDEELGRLRGEAGPDDPILVAIDYGQILEPPGDDPRGRVSATWEGASAIARHHRAVILMLSQMSRAASRAARAGERMGAEAIDGGAESAAIERWSTVVLEIGPQQPEDAHGRREVALSIAKGRMSGGDAVVPMVYEGRTGRWAVVGDARPAAEVRAEAEAEREDRRARNAELAIVAVAERADEPLSRRDLTERAAVRHQTARQAIARLLERGDLVEVARRRRSRHWLIWTRERADAEGIDLAPSTEEEHHA